MSSSDTGSPSLSGANQPLLVDFPPKAGLKEVSLSPQDLAARSAAAVDSAMSSIRQMAERVSGATERLARPPGEVEVEFGLKLDAAGGALVARASVEAHLVVTLRWTSTGGNEECHEPNA